MAFPDSIYEQREVENLAGIEYDPNNKRSLYAEDIMGLGHEIKQIEEALGLNLSNIEDLINYIVDERLDGGGGGGGFLYEKKSPPSGTNTIVFDTPVSMDELTYLKLQYMFPGRLLNSTMRLLFNNDTTYTNYRRTLLTANYANSSVGTSMSSILPGFNTDFQVDNYTTTWVFELRKVPGKFLNVKGWSSTDGAAIDTGFRHLNLIYTGSAADITDIRFKVDTGNFPVGTVAIMSGV